MEKFDRQKKIAEGLFALGWLTFSGLIFVITLIAWLIWKTKIALFLMLVGALLLVIFIILFLRWKHSLRQK